MFYLGYEMDKIKADVVLQRRKERYVWLLALYGGLALIIMSSYRQMQLSMGDFSVDDGSRMEMGRVIDMGSKFEGPGYGDRCAPVNNDNSAPGSSEPTYPPSSHVPDRNTLTPYVGGYAGTGKRHYSSWRLPASLYALRTPSQSTGNENTLRTIRTTPLRLTPSYQFPKGRYVMLPLMSIPSFSHDIHYIFFNCTLQYSSMIVCTVSKRCIYSIAYFIFNML